MQIELLTSTQDALQTVFTAIRTCYSAQDQMEVWNKDFAAYKENNNDHVRLVKQIVNHGHTSTLEHINFTFAIMGVSRSLLAQLTRHRIGFSYSVQSQRYVKQSDGSKHGGFKYITPPSIQDRNGFGFTINENYHAIMKELQAVYDKLVSMGIKAEDARYVLPNAATTNITMTINLRAALDFYSKRNDNTHAQWEIQELAEAIRTLIVSQEPWTESMFDDIKAKDTYDIDKLIQELKDAKETIEQLRRSID